MKSSFVSNFIIVLLVASSTMASAKCIGHEDPNDPDYQAWMKATQNKKLTETDWKSSNGIVYTYVLRNGQLFAHVISIPASALLSTKNPKRLSKLSFGYGLLASNKTLEYPVAVCSEADGLSIAIIGGGGDGGDEKVKVSQTAKGIRFTFSDGEHYDAERLTTKTAVAQ